MASVMFHSSPLLLAPGDVILPGNYGRIIASTGPAHAHWLRETVLEEVRRDRFPDKPSRLSSCFACPTEEIASFYWAHHAPRDALYVVQKVLQEAAEHRADFNVVQPLPRRPENMEEIADLYWRAALWIDIAEYPGVRCEEVVTPSPLRIMRRL